MTALVGRVELATGSCGCQIACRGRHGHAYNEEAFRYLVAVERERDRRRGGGSILCLATVEGDRATVDRALAILLFDGLGRTLRETDVIGWYLEDRVIGALLTDAGNALPPEVLHRVACRVESALRARLPSRLGHRLKLSFHRNTTPDR